MFYRKSCFISVLTSVFFAGVSLTMGVETAFEFENVRSGRAAVDFGEDLRSAPSVSEEGLVYTGLGELDAVLEKIGASAVSQAAPDFRPGLYLIEFDEVHSVEEAVIALKGCGAILNAWPCPLVEWDGIRFNPDDFMMPNQWHHETMENQEAWAIFRGDASVQVGIIDGGVTYIHPDLAGNIWINPDEDLNGNRIIEDWEVDSLDNDGNGYIDDFWGWDWIDLDSSQVWPGEDPGPPDNDPSDFNGHGTHCAGDACASTNNGVGVASPGFNSQIMCLRAGYMSSSGMGYVDLFCAMQAVYYAINMEAEALSMSFGGPGMVPFFRDALSTANDSGLVLLAAAGNDNSSQIQYPAGYDFVIAVAATAEGDIKADFSSYGTWVTVSAPGDAIFSTIVDGYGNMSGTSMSTPVTAGVAALVKALMPEWSSMEVGNWLAETADDIDPLNPGYAGMLGGGRVNARKAVDLFVSVDSLWTDIPVDDNRLYFDQEGALFVQYHKLCGDAYDVSLEVSSDNPRVDFIQSAYYIGDISEGEVGDNSDDPFLLTVQYGGEDFEIIEVNAHFTGDGFQFTQILQVQAGRGDVLIIDADQYNDERTSFYYENSMDAMGYYWETWKRSERGELGDELSEYDVVIVFSGTAETDILSADDWEDLDDYLAQGGNLIVTGQNIAEDLAVTQPVVLSDILRVDFIEAHSGDLTISGSPGNPLTGGMYFVMAGSGGAWNQNSLDVVNALPGAESFFVYDEDEPDEMAGVRVQSGLGDLFFCSFGIEGINDSTSSGNTKLEALAMMFEEFGVSGVGDFNSVVPAVVRLFPPYPNPFNSTLKIVYELSVPGAVTLTIYDVLGREAAVYHLENAPVGRGEWNWDAGGTVSSGVYFVRLEGGGVSRLQKAVFLK